MLVSQALRAVLIPHRAPRFPVAAGLLVAAVVSLGCEQLARTPVGPTAGGPGSVAPEATVSARVVDALTGFPVADATVSSGSVATRSDATGQFALTTTHSPSVALRVTVPGFVVRETSIRAGSDDVSLIPEHFNLAAFDTMIRPSKLYRWVQAPPLVVLATPVLFTRLDAQAFVASRDTMPAEEYASLVEDLTWALPQLTGGAFAAFGSVTRTTADEGAAVSPLTPGVITVVTVEGLCDATSYWGYARALVRGDGTVTGGVVMLDSAMNRTYSRHRRSLRAHELGHALGYGHLTTLPSVMHPSATIEPTSFDLEATRIAFRRPPGNTAPDRDAGIVTLQLAADGWTTPTP